MLAHCHLLGCFIPITSSIILQVNQIGLYRGFIENYEEAVEVVRKCTQTDPRFRTLAEVLTTLLPEKRNEYMSTQVQVVSGLSLTSLTLPPSFSEHDV